MMSAFDTELRFNKMPTHPRAPWPLFSCDTFYYSEKVILVQTFLLLLQASAHLTSAVSQLLYQRSDIYKLFSHCPEYFPRPELKEHSSQSFSHTVFL